MWSTTILLHRPFIETWHPDSRATTTSAIQVSPSDICLSAANQICLTIQLYSRYMCGLPCDLIFPIFVAANILLHHWRQAGGNDILIKQRLELCIKWLNGLGKSWKSAEKRHQILSECKKNSLYDWSFTNESVIAINIPSQDAQIQRIQDANESAQMIDNFFNSTMPSINDSFNLEYLQWVDSFDFQGYLDQ